MTDHKAHVRVLKGFAAAYTGETGEAFHAAIAALTAAHADHKAEWVLVPRVATEAMREAFRTDAQYTLGELTWATFDSRYAAMLAAAPAASDATINSDGIDTKLIDAASEGEDGAGVAFDSAEALADWLETLHEAEGPAVMCGKWEPAQVAARAIREHLATQPAARRVTDEDVEAVERAVGFSARGWDMADPKEIIAAARRTATPTDAARVRDAERYLYLRDRATASELEAFATRRGTRLAADRVCDAGIDAALAAVEGGG